MRAPYQRRFKKPRGVCSWYGIAWADGRILKPKLVSGQHREGLYKARMTKRLNIAVAGCAGRMGRQLLAVAHGAGHNLSGGSEAPQSPAIGTDLGALVGREPIGVTVQSNIQ